jgi:hypothetical protein
MQTSYIVLSIVVVAILAYAAYRIANPPTDVYDETSASSGGKLLGFPQMDVAGHALGQSANTYCRNGLTMPEVVDGENGLWRFQIYTVQPGVLNSKFMSVQM